MLKRTKEDRWTVETVIDNNFYAGRDPDGIRLAKLPAVAAEQTPSPKAVSETSTVSLSGTSAEVSLSGNLTETSFDGPARQVCCCHRAFWRTPAKQLFSEKKNAKI